MGSSGVAQRRDAWVHARLVLALCQRPRPGHASSIPAFSAGPLPTATHTDRPLYGGAPDSHSRGLDSSLHGPTTIWQRTEHSGGNCEATEDDIDLARDVHRDLAASVGAQHDL